MPRALLYARVSTGAQDPGLQLDELRAVAGQRGWTIAGEVLDQAVSGARETRPGLDRVLELARRGQVDVLAVWRLDRLARSVRHLLTLAQQLQAWGVDLVSVRDPIDTTTPAGRFTFQVLGAVAELERELIRERAMAGQARARAAGKHCGRPRVHLLDPEQLAAAIQRHGGQRSAARALGLSWTTFRRLVAGPKAPPLSLSDRAGSTVPDHTLQPLGRKQ